MGNCIKFLVRQFPARFKPRTHVQVGRVPRCAPPLPARRAQSDAPHLARAISWLGLAVMLLASCASESPKPPPWPAARPVWPLPPDEPRIAFPQAITQPQDVGIRPSAFRRPINWITGDTQGNELPDK